MSFVVASRGSFIAPLYTTSSFALAFPKGRQFRRHSKVVFVDGVRDEMGRVICCEPPWLKTKWAPREPKDATFEIKKTTQKSNIQWHFHEEGSSETPRCEKGKVESQEETVVKVKLITNKKKKTKRQKEVGK